jgi:uncharacterized membrane-anchored protein
MSSSKPVSASSPLNDQNAGYVMRKLPHVTVLFWILKTIAVTLGETGGDLFGITLGLGYLTTAAAFLAFFAVVVALQVNAGRFRPVLFWTVVLSTSMVGTEISDFMNRGFGHASDDSGGIGYTWGGVILTSLLAVVFLVWWRTGQTYDVENIATRKGEILYWLAILISNTLGTSSGDVLAHETPLGFRGAFFVMSAVMLLLLAAHYLTAINGTVLFWIAFVLTRPLGAAGGDYLVKPVDEDGLGWGTLWGSVALLSMLVVFTGYQVVQVRQRPLSPLPVPVNRRTGGAQRPNGQVVDGLQPTPEPPAQDRPRSARSSYPRLALFVGVLAAVAVAGAAVITAGSHDSTEAAPRLQNDGAAAQPSENVPQHADPGGVALPPSPQSDASGPAGLQPPPPSIIAGASGSPPRSAPLLRTAGPPATVYRPASTPGQRGRGSDSGGAPKRSTGQRSDASPRPDRTSSDQHGVLDQLLTGVHGLIG